MIIIEIIINKVNEQKNKNIKLELLNSIILLTVIYLFLVLIYYFTL